MLSERRGLYRQNPRAVRVSCRHDALWERCQPDVLRGWTGVSAWVPNGIVAGDSLGMCERDDLNNGHDDGNLILFFFFDQ